VVPAVDAAVPAADVAPTRYPAQNNQRASTLRKAEMYSFIPPFYGFENTSISWRKNRSLLHSYEGPFIVQCSLEHFKLGGNAMFSKSECSTLDSDLLDCRFLEYVLEQCPLETPRNGWLRSIRRGRL
jgi:hypothetical protein